MDENVKSAPAPQGDASAKAAPKSSAKKTTKATDADKPVLKSGSTDAEMIKDNPDPGSGPGPDALQPNSETSTGTTVEKHEVTDPAAKAKGEAAAEQAEKQDYRKEADKILKAVAKGTAELKVAHKAAVLAINTPGAVFDQEEKVLSYQGGKTKLVIE